MADNDQRAEAAAAAPAAPQSLGSMLKQARLARDLTLEQVSTELRIEPVQLDALEQDRFERIGVPVFVKGYLRQYGTFLGLDTRDLLSQYYKQNALKEIQIQPSKTITLRDERQITLWVVAALVLAAVLAALGYWWWSGLKLPAISTPASQTNAAGDSAAAPAPASAPAGDARESIVTAAPVAAAAPPPAEIAVSSAASAAPLALSAAAASNDAAPAAAAPEPVSDPLAVVATLDVTFEQESWAEINDARGQRLFYGLGAAGRSATFSGAPPFAVTLGNSAGVKLVVDGEVFPVPSSGKPGEYARFNVDVAGD